MAKERFGVTRLRPGQREVLEAVFRGRDVLALMPTGSGKSLCYQLPALFLGKPVVVVSPLIALMQDQQEKAAEAEIAVEKLDSTLSAAQQQEVKEHIGKSIPQLLYVTPERLENTDFMKTLKGSGVSLLAIDEAHLIAQWGHDFRPAYMGLGEARQQLGNPPVILLTATASRSSVDEILQQLRIKDPVIVNTGIERENLTFSVQHTVNDEAKRRKIAELLAEQEGTGIIYTASVKTANELFEWLRDNDVSVGRYHGKLPPKERAAVQSRFMAGEYKVLIATKAFGMGINKPDIRFVYHYEFPDSLESYYQEAGRAGRDGKPATAVLLYRLEDRRIQRFFLLGRYPRLHELDVVLGALEVPSHAPVIAERTGMAVKRVQAILYILKAAGLVRRTARGYSGSGKNLSGPELEALIEDFQQRGEEDTKRLGEMMRYAESPECRKQLLRQYFEADPGDACGECDNCVDSSAGSGFRHADELPRSVRDEVQKVTAIDTAVGVVATTAPETLPVRDGFGFREGDMVRHPRFGSGHVMGIDGENLLVRFADGMKRVRRTYVKAA